MGCFVYCLFSTEDGHPRYVGQTGDSVDRRLKQHVVAALDKKPGALCDWMRDVWRRGYEIEVYTLQKDIMPKDVLNFEKYWTAQFNGLLNSGLAPDAIDTPLGAELRAALRMRIGTKSA
jgi:hypothetical protein